MKRSYDDSAEFWAQNQRFHSELAEAGDSRVIKMIVDSLKFIADGASSGVHYERRELADVIRAHTKIVDLLEAGDVEGAAKSMHHHLDSGRRFIAKNQPYALRSRIHWPE
jgi:DNA-binding GntR family transcriptional regulator